MSISNSQVFKISYLVKSVRVNEVDAVVLQIPAAPNKQWRKLYIEKTKEASCLNLQDLKMNQTQKCVGRNLLYVIVADQEVVQHRQTFEGTVG